jgi:large subunit ribosomal protein L32
MAGGQTPKQKQSHARTHHRRAQHKIAPASSQLCPRCHQPKLPHRVCGECGSYAGREVIDAGPGAPAEE